MTLSTPDAPVQPSLAEAARRLAAVPRPLPLGAWREVTRTGGLVGDSDPDATAAGLVRRWNQHLAVVLDLPIERYPAGEERLPALVTEWLDLARRTANVRAHVAATAGPRAQAEAARQRALLATLLAEDLTALGAPQPGRSALDLVTELTAVAAAEDAAGRPLPEARAALLGGTGLPVEPPRRERLLDRVMDRLACCLRLTRTA